jgi:hypothetical protein
MTQTSAKQVVRHGYGFHDKATAQPCHDGGVDQ